MNSTETVKWFTLPYALRLALLYGLLGGVWILVYDHLLGTLVADPHRLTALQTYKAWVFVAASSLLLYIAVRQELQAREKVEEALQQQLRRMSLFSQMTRAGLERQDLGSIFRVVLAHLEDDLPIETGSVSLYDPHTDALTVVARGSKSQPLSAALGTPEGTTIPVEQAGLRSCVQGETVYLSDTAAVDAPLWQAYAQQEIRSAVAVPLKAENKVFGILGVTRREANGFSRAEVEFLQALGEHIALAARQARLCQELQQAYDDLRQTQQAVMQQERLRALGQMASGIAHDINNALSPIVGFTELLLMSEPNLSDRARQYLKTILTAGTDITFIVARMREFYRQREPTEPLLPVPLNEVVTQAINLTRPRWRDIPLERGVVVKINTDLSDDLPPIPGVASELREALTNLILNAVDAMPDGGVVTIRTRAYETGKRGNGETESPVTDSVVPQSGTLLRFSDFVVLEVCDTGTGMDEETRQRCLEPFYSTKGERGTGLGLAMVYGIVQRHDGDIEIESALGQGTTVRLVFPLKSPQAISDGVNAETFTPVAPLRILCLDDEPLLRELMKEMLEVDGHRVEVADSGQAGLNAFRAAVARGEPFDVVITDLGMPHVDGREVARTVKCESPQTGVILLTGWGALMRSASALPTAAGAVLSKPPRLNEVRQAIARVKGKSVESQRAC